MAGLAGFAIDALIGAFDVLSATVSVFTDLMGSVSSIFEGLSASMPMLLPALLGLATYALLAGNNFTIMASKAVVGWATTTAGVVKSTAAAVVHYGAMAIVGTVYGTLMAAQILLSASTYKTIAAVVADSAAWAINMARKVRRRLLWGR